MKKILVIDDDQNILEVVKIILMANGFEVHTYSSGLHVPEVVLEYYPDIILLDIRLPGNAGTEICKNLRQMNCTIPIVLFSAYSQLPGFLDSWGADAFMQKPFDIKNLINTVKWYMN